MHQPLRVSLRHVDEEGTAHDLVGDLVLADDHRVVVLPAGRGPVEVPRAQVRAMRRVPPRVVRPSSGVADVERLAALGWPGLEVVRLGGWSLHAGNGFTHRANSCHPTGDPGLPLAEAVDAVVRFYRDRGLPATVQMASRQGEPPGDLERLLDGRGWRILTPSVVMVADLTQASADGPPSQVRWSDTPDEEWQSVDPPGHRSWRDVMTIVPAQYATLSVDGRPAGHGRLVQTDDWSGLAAVHVDPALRGRGHGRALTVAMTARARELGSRWAYLQVTEENAVARRLYASLGFSEHHRYHYRQAPA